VSVNIWGNPFPAKYKVSKYISCQALLIHADYYIIAAVKRSRSNKERRHECVGGESEGSGDVGSWQGSERSDGEGAGGDSRSAEVSEASARVDDEEQVVAMVPRTRLRFDSIFSAASDRLGRGEAGSRKRALVQLPVESKVIFPGHVIPACR
jgi:hypothetical protein